MEFPPPPRHRAKPLPQASHSPAAPKGAAPLTKSQGLPPPLRGFHHRAGLPSPRDHTRLLIGGAGGRQTPTGGCCLRRGRAPGGPVRSLAVFCATPEPTPVLYTSRMTNIGT